MECFSQSLKANTKLTATTHKTSTNLAILELIYIEHKLSNRQNTRHPAKSLDLSWNHPFCHRFVLSHRCALHSLQARNHPLSNPDYPPSCQPHIAVQKENPAPLTKKLHHHNHAEQQHLNVNAQWQPCKPFFLSSKVRCTFTAYLLSWSPRSPSPSRCCHCCRSTRPLPPLAIRTRLRSKRTPLSAVRTQPPFRRLCCSHWAPEPQQCQTFQPCRRSHFFCQQNQRHRPWNARLEMLRLVCWPFVSDRNFLKEHERDGTMFRVVSFQQTKKAGEFLAAKFVS